MKKSALIVIDLINDLVNPKGKMPGCAPMVTEKQTLKKANTLIQHAEKNDWPIIFVKVAFSENYPELPVDTKFFARAKEVGALKNSTWGTEYVDELLKPKNVVSIVKNRVSAFYETNLNLLLKSNQIVDLYLCGVSTEMAIQTTAREACDRDYKVHIVSDACASNSEEIHTHSLQILQRLGNIVTVEDCVK